MAERTQIVGTHMTVAERESFRRQIRERAIREDRDISTAAFIREALVAFGIQFDSKELGGNNRRTQS